MGTSKRKMAVFLSCITLILYGCGTIKNNVKDKEEWNILIKQTSLSGVDFGTTYIINPEQIQVWDNNGLVYSSNFSLEDRQKLEIHTGALDGLKKYYDSNMIGGFTWQVVIRENNNLSFVFLSNVSFESTNLLFQEVNRILPEKLTKIYIREVM